MITVKKYEILDALPTYGPMYVSITDDDLPFYSQGFTVRFYRSDNTEWVANFKPGDTRFNYIHELTGQNKLLIISGGTCYIMSPDNEKPLSIFGGMYSNALHASDGRLVLEDYTNLTVMEMNGDHWTSERISWDGLKDLKIDGSIVTGLSYNPIRDADEWIEFSYNIDTKLLIGGSYKKYNPTKKSTWKIWLIILMGIIIWYVLCNLQNFRST